MACVGLQGGLLRGESAAALEQRGGTEPGEEKCGGVHEIMACSKAQSQEKILTHWEREDGCVS